jgi:acetylornithine deacetylase
VVAAFESLGLDPDVREPDADALRDHLGYFETTSSVRQGYEGRPNVAAVVAGDGDGCSHVETAQALALTTVDWCGTVD